MSNNREFSQLASFITVDETNNFIGIATNGTQLVGIGTSSITLDGRTGIVSAKELYVDGINVQDLISSNTFSGITVKEDGSTVGTASSILTLDFVGTRVTATASGSISTITVSDYVSYSNVAGIATSVIGGIASVTQLNVSGVSTLGTVEISSGIVTATSGIVTYYGDGSKLSNIISGIAVQDEGSAVGTSVTTLNFSGATISVSNVVNGISTVTVTASGIITYVDNAGIATNLKGGLAGNIPYQSAPNTTTFLTNGVSGTILQSNGVGNAPTWVSAAPASAITGLTIRDEGTIVGGANSVSQLNFVGNIVSVASTAGIATVTFLDYVANAGIATYATSAGVATALQNSRTFEITGDIVASAISFNGTGNVSLAATIQPNSVALGTDTTGDYVQSISGTSNQITVTGGTGEGSTPTLSVPNQFTAPQDVTVTRDLQVNRNLNVTGNITIGGTSATIFSQTLNIYDPDIVLGYRTDGSGNDISNDNTANHGGVAVASTEGSPLVQLFIAGIETNPATYKKIMWFNAGTFSGLGTDAWLSNYAVGIGSTQFPTGTRLAAGAVQFTERDLAVIRNINASGIITGTLANTLTLNTSGTGLSGSTTYNNSGATTFTVTSNATSNNTPSTIVARDGSGNFSAGTITANLTGTASTASFATTAFNLSDAANITTGTINSARLSGTYNISINGNAATATYATNAGIATYATSAGIATYATTAGVSTSVIGGTGSLTQLQVTGISTFTNGPVFIGSATSTGTASQPLQITGGAYVSGNLGIGTTNPQATLQVGTGITMYGVTGIISATSYRGDGSQLTGVSAGLSITDDTSTNATRYILFDDVTSGTITGANVSSTKLTFNPSTGNLVAGGTVTANSDEKLKENVKTIENALDKILSLRGVEFDRIDTGDHQIGVIAQEVEEIIPEVVYGTETKSVAYGNLIGLLIEAIKEQNQRIDELERRLGDN